MNINDLPIPIPIPNKYEGRYVNINDLPIPIRIPIPLTLYDYLL